jgi:DNA-binding MarR family transcriptional regulator
MKKASHNIIEQPLGRILSNLAKDFLCLINKKLTSLELERNFYALLLIELGKGEINQQDLADLLETDKVSIVRIVNYLSEKGYVERLKKNTDKRKFCLMITQKAKKDLPRIKKTLNDVTEIAFEGLNPSQIEQFLKTLNIIKHNLNR